MTSNKRELIDTGNDKRYVKRDSEGRFKDIVDVGSSLATDRKQHSKTKVKSGEGDRGDRGTATSRSSSSATVRSTVLGRSSATGKYVLSPATGVSMARAKKAVEAARTKRK
jgi:hypothetical protein